MELSVEDFSLLYKDFIEKEGPCCVGLEEMYEYILDKMEGDFEYFACIWFNLGYIKGTQGLDKRIVKNE